MTAPLGTEYTYSIDGTTFQSSPVFNNLGDGAYTITVRSTAAGSCEGTTDVTIDAPTGAPTVTATAVDPTCADPAEGSITVTAPLGTEYTYSIDGTNFQSSPTFSGVGTGTYTITAKAIDNLGLETTSAPVTITVSANQAPSVTITAPANGTSYIAPATFDITATAYVPLV